MKKGLVPGMVILCAALTLATHQVRGELPANSVHRVWDDPAAWSTCTNCHAPSDEATTRTSNVKQTLLWNPSITADNFSAYSSPTMNGKPGAISGSSMVCLSCHDGVVASMKEALAIGRDGLANDHPISFPYTSSLAFRDGRLFDPASTPSGLGGTIAEDLLRNDTMQCTSCHVFHATATTAPNLLVKPNTGSRLCLTCHNL